MGFPDLTDSGQSAVADAVLLRQHTVGGEPERAEEEIARLWSALHARRQDPAELVSHGHLAAAEANGGPGTGAATRARSPRCSTATS